MAPIPIVVPLASRIARLKALKNAEEGAVVTFQADTAVSPTLSNISSPVGLTIGMTLTGVAIAPGATIVAIDSIAGTITMSAAATAVHVSETITATSAPGGPVTLRLFSAPFTVDDLTTEADLVPLEATFDTYPPGGYTLTFTEGYITPDLIPSNESNAIQAIMPNPVVTPNDVYGGWWRNSNGLIAGFNLPAPVSLSEPGNALKIMLEDSYPPGLPSQQIVP